MGTSDKTSKENEKADVLEKSTRRNNHDFHPGNLQTLSINPSFVA
jgi:hypothetical protein